MSNENFETPKDSAADEENEKAKYLTAWGGDTGYRDVAPGEYFVGVFLDLAAPARGQQIIDFGTGTGRAALKLQEAGLDVIPVDIAENCLDPRPLIKLHNPIVVGNLWGDLDLPQADYGYCTDVMEHIPQDYVFKVLGNIKANCKRAFFTICFEKDHFGQKFGTELHLTVQPFTWWRDILRGFGELLEARDLVGEGVFYVDFQ